jgi:hypothetical protein
MTWVQREGSDIKPAMTEEQLRIFREQCPEEFYKMYREE